MMVIMVIVRFFSAISQMGNPAQHVYGEFIYCAKNFLKFIFTFDFLLLKWETPRAD